MYQIFIGLNQNATGYYKPVDRQKLQQFIDERFSNYSLLPIQGKYEGSKEDTLTLLISELPLEVLKDFCDELKATFNQDCIGVLKLPDMQFF